MASFDVVIVGSGHGGAQAAISLRQLGFAGTIALVSAEPDLPYERPPLSKDYLSGERPFERLLIRPAAFWSEREIALQLGEAVTAIDPERKTLITTRQTLHYGQLIWAAGGMPKRLSCPGAELSGVHTIRSRADADRLMTALPEAARAVVIGGGYVGLEAAAILAKLGKSVTLLESLDRVLARVAGVALSRFLEAEHRRHAVDIRLNTQVVGIEGSAAVSGVRLSDGAVISADLVIVGIGIAPAIGPLHDAGARIADGVCVDAECRTTLPDVFAIGDCAQQENRFARGAMVRLESVQNATDQARQVAKTIVGLAPESVPAPWFWSNQYDLKLQTIGLSTGHDQTVVRGDPATRSFSVIYFRQGQIVAVDAVNAVRDYVQAKALIERGAVPDPRLVADPEVTLKSLL